MYPYTIIEWFLFFYIYCFFGWCIESTYVSLRKHKFVNRGFMRGPFLPLYGSGAIVMLIVSIPVQDNIIAVFFFGAVAASILEYCTGVCMEALFKVRYWDYSNNFCNLNGHICLGTSIAWGFLTVLLIRVIHRPIEEIVLALDVSFETLLVLVLTVFLASDLAISFKSALDIRDVLDKMTKAKLELLRIQKRLDDLATAAGVATSGFKENVVLKFEAIKDTTTQKTEELLQNISNHLDLLMNSEKEEEWKKDGEFEEYKAEIDEIRTRLIIARQKRIELPEHLGFLKRDLIKGHPTARSKKFAEAFDELKEAVGLREKKDAKKREKKKNKRKNKV